MFGRLLAIYAVRCGVLAMSPKLLSFIAASVIAMEETVTRDIQCATIPGPRCSSKSYSRDAAILL